MGHPPVDVMDSSTARKVMEVDLPGADYRALIEQVQAAVFVIKQGRFLFVNPKLTELFGYSCQEMLSSLDPLELCAPEYRDLVREQTRARVDGVPGKAYEIECVRKNGERFYAQVWGTRIDFAGEVADLVTLHDVSAIRSATRYAQQRAQLFHNAEELARIGSAEVDHLAGTVTLSAGMQAILGIQQMDVHTDMDWLLSRVPAVERPYVQAISEGVSIGDACEFQHRIIHADGSLRTVLHRVVAEADEQGQLVRTVTLLQDLTLQRAAEQRIDKLANTDEVTGLPNRTALTEFLDTRMREAVREERQIAVLSLEIDRLKLVSESLGYAAGDQLLMEVGARFQRCASAHDLLGHLGHGEFLLVLVGAEDIDEKMACGTARALIEALSQPVDLGSAEIKVACDVGITLFPSHGDGDPEKLFQQAQAAMYRAHEMGKNQICLFSSGMQSRAISKLAIESGLRRALDRGELVMKYQPKLDLVGGAIIGAEAIMEWNSPDRVDIPDSSIIRVAEETGLILPIGEWILKKSCLQALEWQRAGYRMRVSVSLSARQLQQSDLPQKIQGILIDTGLDPRLLGLEVAESALVGESTRITRILGELKALGIEIALDDFGTGYSSLSYLRTLPIDVVKVDRSFVPDVTASAQDVSITRAIINMAHSLQMKVLAEGVETEGQLALLIANHCDQMQGTYFSDAVTAEVLAEMLQSKKSLPENLLLRRAHQRTLLLVDDEENIVSALRRLLRRDGYHIVTANSGPQGLQRLAENAVDVIISDQRMPGMTGVEFLRQAKELYPDTIRMVLSGYTELQSITDAINEGAIYKFLTKPWDDERLRIHVGEAFSQKEMADENRRLASAVLSANQELSALNERLQRLLKNQREQIHREESSLNVARNVLDNIPAAVVGVDLEGMVAFVNADAEMLLGKNSPLIGQDAHAVFPEGLRHIWQEADQNYHDVYFDDKAFRVVCRPVGEHDHSRGRLLVLVPSGTSGGGVN